MRPILAACLALTGCVNFSNTYAPEGPRKPLDGRGPAEFPTFVELNKTATTAYTQLNAPAGVVLKLRVACEGSASVKVRVNARLLGSHACPLDVSIPSGIVQPDTPTVVELEAASPVTFRRIAIER